MIRIGMIGMSAGNAHPYSWSSIINGMFNGQEISGMGYPAVSAYLEANRDTLGISNARVTHIWTQDTKISESIAHCCGITHISGTLREMSTDVDAVILARDDAEFHVEMSKPFIEAGIPVFIDKPLAISEGDLNWFAEQQSRQGIIMSCSSMRYANECRSIKQDLASLGDIRLVTAVGKKDWLKYGVHLLEAVFSVLDDPRPAAVQWLGEHNRDIVHLSFDNGLHITLHLFMDISSTFQVTFFGDKAWKTADIKNSYSMFRDNIIEFVRSVEQGKPRLEYGKTHNIISALIGAQKSKEQGGVLIRLNH